MSETSGETRRWNTHVPPRRLSAQRWRSGFTHGSVQVQHRRRRMRIVLFTGLLAAVAGVILTLLWPIGPPAPVHVVALGASSYPDRKIPPNPFGREDVALLEAELPAVHVWDDKLNVETFLQSLSAGAASAQGNLVCYFSLHGTVEPGTGKPGTGAARFLVRNGTVAIPDIIAELKRTPAKHVLCLVDAGRLRADWKLGILENDFATQLEEDLRTADLPNLCVIASAKAGERSWTIDRRADVNLRDDGLHPNAARVGSNPRYDSEGQHSLFAHFVVKGLHGEADGWGEHGERDHARNHRISSGELFWYLKKNVEQQAKKNYGASQTVWRAFGGPQEFDFDLPVMPPDDPAKPGSEAGPPATAVANSDGVPDGAAAPEAAASPAETPPRKQVLHQRLQELWRQRDQLNDRNPAAQAPYRWRSLQAHLVVAERQWKAALWEESERSLEIAEDLLREVQGEVAGGAFDEEAKRLPANSLALARRSARPTLSAATRQQLDEILALVEQPPSDPEKLPAVTEPLAKFLERHQGPARFAVGEWVLQEAMKNASAAKLRSLRPVLAELGDPTSLPAELVLVSQLAVLAGDPSAEARPWPASLCAQAVRLRARAEQLAAEAPEGLPFVRPELRQALECLAAAERWLLNGGVHQDLAKDWLSRAEQLLDEKIAGSNVLKAIHLRHRLLATLPDYAKWTANRAEAHRGRELDAASWQALAEALREPRSGGSAESAAAIETALSREEAALFKLIAGVAQMNEVLLQAPAGAAFTDSQMARLTELSRSTENLWDAFESQFRETIETLADSDHADWQELEDALEVPWIDADLCRKLLSRWEAPRRVLPFSSAAEQPSWAGLWRGFWAIHTLRLAGGESTADLAAHWQKLAAEAADAELAGHRSVDFNPREMALRLVHGRARLGAKIESAWTGLGRELEGLEPAVPSNGGFSRAELLARLVDPLDAPRIRGTGPMRNPDVFINADRETQLREWLQLHAEIAAATAAPRLQVESDLYFKPAEAAKFTIGLSGGAAEPQGPPLRIHFLPPDDVDVLQEGRPVDHFVAFSTAPRPPALELRPRPTFRGAAPLVLALERDDGFPLEIRTVQLHAPVDPRQWQIDFISAQDGFPGPEVEREADGEFNLPLPAFSPAPFRLKAILKKPDGDETGSVTVTVFRRSMDFNSRDKMATRETPLGPPQELKFEPGSRQAVLPFPVPAPPAAANPGAPPGSAPGEAADPAVDISHGLVFQIERNDAGSRKVKSTLQPGDGPIRLVVYPKFWPAEKYLEHPSAEFADGTIKVDARLKKGSPLANVPVSLELPENVRALVQESLLVSDSPQPLHAKLSDQRRQVLGEREFEIALSAGGIPHAYRWTLQEGRAAKSVPAPRVKIVLVEPAGGMLLQGRDKSLRVRFEIDANQIDPQRDTLAYGLASASRQVFTPVEIPLSAPWEKRVRIQTTDAGEWAFQTEAADYVRDIPLPAGLLGRFDLWAELKLEREKAGPDSHAIIIDNDDPPNVAVALPATHIIGKRLRGTITAEDAISGIGKIILAIDRDGDGQLNEKTEALRSWASPLTSEVPFDVPLDKLPAAPGPVVFLVVATNGVEVANTVSKRVEFVKEEAPPAPAGLGSIRITVDLPRYTYEWSVKGPKAFAKKLPSNTASHTFSDLPPGKYEVKVESSDRRAVEQNVEVKVNQTTPVELKPRFF